MPNKSLDGIKKLSGEELAKARKIVLDSIGETDKKEERKTLRSLIPPLRDRDRQARGGEKSFSSPGRKMLDGISSNPVRSASKKIVITKNEALKEKEAPVISVPPAPLLRRSRPVAFKRSLANGIARIGEAARGEEGFRKQENKKARKQENKAEEEMRIKEERKRKEAETRKQGEEKARRKEAKNREEREKERVRQKRKNQRGRARKRWLFEIKRKLSGLLDSFWKSFRLAGKILAFSALFLTVLAILFYLIFASLLLKFNLDNQASRQIANFLPVPAVITKIGFIEYYSYQNIMSELKKELTNQPELEQAARVVFIEKISLAKLARKYNISLIAREQEEVEKEINVRLAVDKEANRVSYSRINKIKELVEASQADGQASESFEKIGEKYGDEQGYVSQDNEFLQLTEEVRQLEASEISEIIITNRGYYIIKKEDKRLKYIFVKSVTLDGYLNKMLNELKVWVLAR